MIADLERPRLPLLRWLWITLAVVIGSPVLFVLCLVVTYGIESATPEDYPRMAPQKMADRATARSQEAYALAGFDTVLPAGVDNSLSAGPCYPRGLESVADTPVDGAYALSHTWQVSDVPREEALAALARLRDRLKEQGWTVTAYERQQGSQDWVLRTERGAGERQVYEWMSDGRGRFSGGVHMECAYDPAADADAGSSGGSSYDAYESHGGSAAADGLVAPALGDARVTLLPRGVPDGGRRSR
ncbi:hypothetical protein [Streptomyces sp. NPDC018833]|uniref:hypothetical protein n=1 Tax=Streptomyces sp. NPDC018833 TaxID=3365053 RepID=UPI00379FBCF3